jgi:hypothetical protein
MGIETRVGLPMGVGFEVHVSWCAISNRSKQMSSCHENMTCFHVGLF